MDTVTSAWPSHPDYRINLVAVGEVARVWFGDLLLAESSNCIRLEETDHVDRLYFPADDVRWSLFEASAAHTACPFKGRADYWDLIAVDPREERLVWGYQTPFPEVAGIEGFVAFYQERVRIEIEERWPDDPDGYARARAFPAWGDQAELIRLMDVQPDGDGRFVGPAYGPMGRNVVEGGQLLGEGIVAVSKSFPGQQVVSGYMTFSKAASFDEPVEVEVEVLRGGRTFTTAEVRIHQAGSFRSGGLFLLGTPAPDLIRGAAPMPDVPGPEDAPFLDMGVVGRELRVVEGAYDLSPDAVGPPEIYTWCRFRDDPGSQYLHAALLAQSTTHWTIAAAMRPHAGVGEGLAHVTLSTGVMSCAIAFHDEFDVRDWHLYANPAIYAGRGLGQGEGRIYARDGRLVASYSCGVMIRAFDSSPAEMGKDYSNVM